jgi:pseudouridine-5'-phosphate glycosidase
MDDAIRVAGEVREALEAGRPVVALETSVVAHGLPSPQNLESARRSAAAVRDAGAVPAVVGVLAGQIVVGLTEAELQRLADPATGAAKAQARDLAALVVAGRDGGTTVSATVAIAGLLGIRVVATGGIGGVHRVPEGGGSAAALDVSADLDELARQPVCVVSAGPKVILDLPATAEALETRGVPAIGLRTSEMPAFYVDASGVALEHRAEDERQAAELLDVHWRALRRREGVLVFVPPPEPLPRERVEGAVATGLAEARARGVHGKEATPFLLAAVARATEGRAVGANLALLERNAAVAGRIAVALAARRSEVRS